MRAERMRRALAAVIGLAVAVAVAVVPEPEPTEAAWTDTEHVAAGSLSAATLGPPQIGEIVNCSGLLGLGIANGVTLNWSWPTQLQNLGFTPAANAQWAFNSAGSNWQSVSTTALGDGVYQTTFNTGVISDILQLLLGGQMTFRVRTKVGDNWISATISSVTFSNTGGPPLGLGPRCTGLLNG